MGCFITKTPTPVCADKKKKGGIKNIWLANANQIDSITTDVSFGNTVITDIAFTGVSSKFHKLDPKLFSAEYKEASKVTNGITEVTQSIEFFIHAQSSELTESVGSLVDPSTEVLVFLQQVADSDGLVVAWEDYTGTNSASGNIYIAGIWKEEVSDFTKFALKLETDEYTSGKALTDVNGDTIKLSAVVPVKRYVFNGTLDESESV